MAKRTEHANRSACAARRRSSSPAVTSSLYCEGLDAQEFWRAVERFTVADLQLDVRRQIRGTAVSAVHLFRQVVKRANAMTALEQLIGQMRADEACTSRDQDRFAHATPMLSDLDL